MSRARRSGVSGADGCLQPGSGLVDGHGPQGPVALLVELGEFVVVMEPSSLTIELRAG
ncbi:hypothetical protein KV205_31580 [Streptomyces sp. SKN60]|uniref:hypothetical protein n=1 Tax=Streptomyces sp. SKN60 TaxID=2855506 RepID=UPI0022453C73|nr:hypothetical protein [Streptomyces sp. SKN60]MCX2185024.1 hypothetical protein [Streptomyces sp. SKN60]